MRIRIDSPSGTHGPIEVESGYIAGVENPTPLEVAAEFTRRLAEDHRRMLGDNARLMGFRAPLTITVDEAP